MSNLESAVRRGFFRPFLAIWLSTSLIGCGEQPVDKPPSTKRHDHLVAVTEVQWKAVSSAHERTGSLRSRRLVRIYNQEEGQIIDLPFFEGDQVKAGDLLLCMDDKLLKAELAKTEATTNQARQNLERISNLVKKRAASQDEFTRANTQLEVATAEQLLLETRLSHTRIAAPFSGVISTRYVEPGDVVSKYTHILTLIDPQSLITEIRLSELLLPHIKTGDPAKVRIDALGDQLFQGRILRIHPELDPVTRQGIIEVALEPVPEGARAGQFARVILETAQVQRMLVPFSAVRHDRNGAFVYLLNHDLKAIRTTVHSGVRIAGNIEILDGLKPGQQIIIRGFLGLNHGKKVKPVARKREN